MFLEVLGLFEDFLEDFVFGVWRVAVVGEDDDEVHLELGFAVGSGGPVDVTGFVVNDALDFLGKVDEFVFFVFEAELITDGFEDVVEGLFFV